MLFNPANNTDKYKSYTENNPCILDNIIPSWIALIGHSIDRIRGGFLPDRKVFLPSIQLIVKCVLFIEYVVSLFLYLSSGVLSIQRRYFHSQKPLSTIIGKSHNMLFVKLSQEVHNKIPMLLSEETMLITARSLCEEM